MKELLPDIFTEDNTASGQPIKNGLNIYIVKGGDRFSSCGTRPSTWPACETAALSFLSELDAPLERDRHFYHAYPCGSLRPLRVSLSARRIRCSRRKKDSGIINAMVDESYWAVVAKNNERAGMPKEEALDYREHVAFRYKTGGSYAIYNCASG